MKIAFYSLFLNHHQACVADEFYGILGDDYVFVELSGSYDSKGATEDYSKRPYLLKAWKSSETYGMAMKLAREAEVCVFAGYESLPFEKERLNLHKLSFEMGERMLKRGWLNLVSPRILKIVLAYHKGSWKNKPLFKLCCSAFTALDSHKLHSFKNKCYKWGYFTHVDEDFDVEASIKNVSTSEITQLMWCGRFLKWKHPELPVQMAAKLKAKGYKFVIHMYGDESNVTKHDGVYSRKRLETLIADLDVGDYVLLMGNRPNNEILNAMKSHHIFLFTSDRMEGWGAVSNESLANGCVLVASDAIGSAPYLIKEGVNGFMYHGKEVDSLTEKVEWLLAHPKEMKQMQQTAYMRMKNLWSPRKAAESFLILIEDLKNNRETSIVEGPCSKA